MIRETECCLDQSCPPPRNPKQYSFKGRKEGSQSGPSTPFTKLEQQHGGRKAGACWLIHSNHRLLGSTKLLPSLQFRPPPFSPLTMRKRPISTSHNFSDHFNQMCNTSLLYNIVVAFERAYCHLIIFGAMNISRAATSTCIMFVWRWSILSSQWSQKSSSLISNLRIFLGNSNEASLNFY